MKRKNVLGLSSNTLFILALAFSDNVYPIETSWVGSAELEQRFFWDDDPANERGHGQVSVNMKMEFFKDWNGGDDQLVFEPFFRLDELDDERTHGDVRQFIWSHLGTGWEFSAGIGQVFWGVTESQHLVDIINQTDQVENIDGEDKLGQPMLRYQYFHDLGNFDFLLLPYFRTRTFAGKENRLYGEILINSQDQQFESNAEQNNLDYALRYSNTINEWGVGVTWFHGTSRVPDLRRFFDPVTASTVPYYAQMSQLGLDIQLTTGSWLGKLEAIKRNYDDALYDDYYAATFGIEYTTVGILGSVYDLGTLVEYSWDGRNESATSAFQKDLFVGARLAFNDVKSSEILFGIINDLDDTSSKTAFVEAKTRIAPSFTVNVELRYFESNNAGDPLYGLREHSFIQFGLEYFFD